VLLEDVHALRRLPRGYRPRRRRTVIATSLAAAMTASMLGPLVFFALITYEEETIGLTGVRVVVEHPLDPPLTDLVLFVGPRVVREASLPLLLASAGDFGSCDQDQAELLRRAMSWSLCSAVLCVDDGVKLGRLIAVQQHLRARGLREIFVVPSFVCNERGYDRDVGISHFVPTPLPAAIPTAVEETPESRP
jgi:hypothetical protein